MIGIFLAMVTSFGAGALIGALLAEPRRNNIIRGRLSDPDEPLKFHSNNEKKQQ